MPRAANQRRLSLAVLRETSARLRLAVAAAAVVLGLAAFAACGGCRAPKADSLTAAEASASARPGAADASAAALPSSRLGTLLWTSAKDGDAEDLATLAAHEGAAGLVEAADDATLRPTAIRAMGFAQGFAQLPFLAKTAGGKDDEEARLALDATLELAVRPRRAEDPEDADELREGCEGLGALARDAARPRPRRVAALRALRMMPCPPSKSGELPTDVDAK